MKTTFCFVFVLIKSVYTLSVEKKIFRQQVGDHSWAEWGLRSPCQATYDEDLPSVYSLKTTLRLHENVPFFEAKSRDLIYRIESLRPISNECEGQSLISLPSTPVLSDKRNLTQITEIYVSLMSLYAHFKYMREDWKSQVICADQFQSAELSRNYNRIALHIQRMTCSMIISTDESLDFKPPAFLAEIIESFIESDLYHYYQCSSRYARDCVVIRYALELLASVLNMLD